MLCVVFDAALVWSGVGVCGLALLYGRLGVVREKKAKGEVGFTVVCYVVGLIGFPSETLWVGVR